MHKARIQTGNKMRSAHRPKVPPGIDRKVIDAFPLGEDVEGEEVQPNLYDATRECETDEDFQVAVQNFFMN